jgi:hypothetical protein
MEAACTSETTAKISRTELRRREKHFPHFDVLACP